ncbi:hypothetical protein F5X96DRAFT_690390 [Biscogniauxia mediterranea]|nr:hypothetical protein F5X96DRAFT_690390 [Biscogniauxia mediterranea]
MAQPVSLNFDTNAAIGRQSSSPLFCRLPLEIRRRIYYYYDLGELHLSGNLNYNYVELYVHHKMPALLLTCRQAYMEVKNELNKYMWFKSYTDRRIQTLKFHVLSTFWLHPVCAQEIIVCYGEVDKVAPQPSSEVVFIMATKLQLEWKRPVESMWKLVKPNSLDDRGLDIMMEQCFYFIQRMPNLREVSLTGFYRRELPDRLTLALQEERPQVKVVDFPEKDVRGGLNGLVQKWREVLNILTEEIQSSLESAKPERPPSPPTPLPALTDEEIIEHWFNYVPEFDWDKAAALESYAKQEDEKKRFGLPYEEIHILKRLANGQEQVDNSIWD